VKTLRLPQRRKMGADIMPAFILVFEENDTEQRQHFNSEDRAVTAWKRANRRNTCYSAQLYQVRDDGTLYLFADYQSE
jgi:hypothetical protein